VALVSFVLFYFKLVGILIEQMVQYCVSSVPFLTPRRSYFTGTTPKDGHFQMISNFTSGIEYYYNVATGTCDLYGLNYWSDWCYGSYNAQTYQKSIHVGSEVADVWGKESTPFTWTNVKNTCAPVSQTRTDTGESTFYFNYKVGAPDASAFVLPAACVSKHAELKDKSSLKPALPTHKAF